MGVRKLLTVALVFVVVLSFPVATVSTVEPFEEDDGYETAERVGPGVYAAEIDGPFDGADADLDLFLDDPDRDEVDSSDGFTGVEAVSTVASETGLYYVWVTPFDAFGVVPYTLETSVGEPSIPGPDPVPDDPFEDTGNAEDAKPITPGSYEAVVADGNDIDVFAVALTEGERLVFDVTFDGLDGEDDQLRFVDPAPYTIDVAVESNPTLPPGDQFEQNDVFGTATPVTPGTIEATASNEEDIDIFVTHLTAATTVTCLYEPGFTNGVVEVRIYGPNQQLIDSRDVRGGGPVEPAVDVPRSGTYYAKATSVDGTTGPYTHLVTEEPTGPESSGS